MDKCSTLTDYELVKMYEQGIDEAFDELLRRHQSQVYSYLMYLVKNETMAEDFLQETFTHVILAIRNHKYQTTGKFNAWLIRIAHNLVIDHTRDADTTRITTHEEFSQSIVNDIKLSEESHERKVIETQESDLLKDLLNHLPDVQREVVKMRFYDDMSFKEIAEKTGVSINTSLGRMRYALINLRKIAGEYNLAFSM